MKFRCIIVAVPIDPENAFRVKNFALTRLSKAANAKVEIALGAGRQPFARPTLKKLSLQFQCGNFHNTLEIIFWSFL